MSNAHDDAECTSHDDGDKGDADDNNKVDMSHAQQESIPGEQQQQEASIPDKFDSRFWSRRRSLEHNQKEI